MEIKIENYLSESEIKEIVQEELREQVRKHFSSEKEAERLLINLSHEIVQQEVEKIVPNHQEMIVKKVASIINDKDLSFYVYRHHYSTDAPQSTGAKILDEAVRANKDFINQKVIDTILNKDYSEEIWNKFESMADTFMSNIYAITEIARKNQNK